VGKPVFIPGIGEENASLRLCFTSKEGCNLMRAARVFAQEVFSPLPMEEKFSRLRPRVPGLSQSPFKEGAYQGTE
jgi:hypothetical protein